MEEVKSFKKTGQRCNQICRPCSSHINLLKFILSIKFFNILLFRMALDAFNQSWECGEQYIYFYLLRYLLFQSEKAMNISLSLSRKEHSM